jgi:DnaJ-class molecular chaperone
MVKDPYKILNVPHSASPEEIKRSYRKLARQYHPDRVTTEVDKENATTAFAEIATAYTLLSDPKKKAQYDHIYKYGGFDSSDQACKINEFNRDSSQRSTATASSPQGIPTTRKRKSSTGIGYVCTDPLAFLWSQGKIQMRQTVAGIQIPSRLHSSDTGLRFAFSAGYVSTRSENGIRQYSCTTTQFAQGKKFTRTETTTFYPDGGKEVIIEGNDCAEQRYYTATPMRNRTQQNNDDEGVTQTTKETGPWYMSAWSEIKDKLTMCYSPSAVNEPQ